MDDVRAHIRGHATHLQQLRDTQEEHFDAIANDLRVVAKASSVPGKELCVYALKPTIKPDKGHKGENSTREKLERHVQKLIQSAIEEAVSYQLQETVWDAAILIGLPLKIGVSDTALLFFAVVMQATIQSILCAMVVVLEHRNSQALANAKKITSTCEEELDTFEAFMKDSLGPLLSCLMVMIWTLCVLKEYRHIFDFMCAVWNLPRWPHHTRLEVSHTTRKVEIVEISYWRLGMVTFSAGIQFSIATCLLGIGCTWLASTVTLTDLLLNGVALQFIMELDELMYFVFCSAKIKTITTSLHPLLLPRRIALPKGVSLPELVSLAIWITFVILCAIVFLKPNFELIDQVLDLRCVFSGAD